VTELRRNTVYGPYPTAEVVVLKGNVVTRIYDGVRINPSEIVARMTYAEFEAKVVDGSVYDYEA
jgi:hypothetical protein